MRNDPDRLDALAAGFVLGTLDAAERREAQARLDRGEPFACLVEAWSERLAPLAEALPSIEPPADLWPRIEGALWPKTAARLRPTSLVTSRRRIPAWRWPALAASVAAAIAMLVAATAPEPSPSGRYIALLESGPAQPAWAVTLDLSDGEVSARPLGRLAAVAGSYELWIVPRDGGAPLSLGLLAPDADRPIRLAAKVLSTVPQASALAVSLEPTGGSPTGLPTGPVLYQGSLLALAD